MDACGHVSSLKSDSVWNFRRDWLFCWRRLFKQTVCCHHPNHSPVNLKVCKFIEVHWPFQPPPGQWLSGAGVTSLWQRCSAGMERPNSAANQKHQSISAYSHPYVPLRNITLTSQHSPYPSSRSASPSRCSFPSFPPAAGPSFYSPRLTGGGNSARGLINTHTVTLWSMKTNPTQWVVCING